MQYSSRTLLLAVLLAVGLLCGGLLWLQSDSTRSADVAGETLVQNAPDVDASGADTPFALQAESGEDGPGEAAPAGIVEETEPAAEVIDPVPGDDADGVLTPEGKRVVSGTIAKGDTAAVLLNRWLPAKHVYSLIETTKNVYSLARIREGQPFVLTWDPALETLECFEYEIDNNQKLIIEAADGGYKTRLEEIEYEVRLGKVEGVITTNLFQAMTDAGEHPSLVMLIASIYAWEINFIKDIREGDSFAVLVEKRYRDGEFKSYGKVLGAYFTNQKKNYQAYRYADKEGHQRYFNENGVSLEKTLLKAPLAFTRITSGYSMNRLHPIHKVRRPHQGIDYGTPTGTPIMAVGHGTVTKVGWVGRYGKQVVVRHSGKLESLYSHMSRYAKGITVGTKVRQGQVIGYVGATGDATGPHLDFRIRQNGKFVNPATVIAPPVDDIEKKQMPAFTAQVEMVRSYLDGSRLLSEYIP